MKKRKNKSVGEWVAIAEKLAKKNGGALPTCSWLKSHGYSGLKYSLMAHPQSFKHIKRAPRRNHTAEEWVPIAEEVAKKNGGILPCPTWLFKNQNALYLCLIKHRKLFKHIKQETLHANKLAANLKLAEELAKKNDGVLPNPAWIQRYYSKLDAAMQNHPQVFKHIKQKRLTNRKRRH
jgi:hypothetical protein